MEEYVVLIKDLIPTERGRTWRDTTERVAELIVSIKHEGLQKPISVYKINEKYYVINGHHRLEAMKRLGYKEIPVKELFTEELRTNGYTSDFEVVEKAYYTGESGKFKVNGRKLNKILNSI